jgi:hypothetical protein
MAFVACSRVTFTFYLNFYNYETKQRTQIRCLLFVCLHSAHSDNLHFGRSINTGLVCAILKSARVAVSSFSFLSTWWFYLLYVFAVKEYGYSITPCLQFLTKLYEKFVRSRSSMDINELRDTTSTVVS